MGLLLCNVMSTVIALVKMDSKVASVLFLVSSKNGIEYLSNWVRDDKGLITFITFSAGKKTLVVGGYPYKEGRQTDIIDMENPSFDCGKENLFPIDIMNAGPNV